MAGGKGEGGGKRVGVMGGWCGGRTKSDWERERGDITHIPKEKANQETVAKVQLGPS